MRASSRTILGQTDDGLWPRVAQDASVPWTMYFHGDFALHGAYWHDGFGQARSSGCVNLSPQDAHRLYAWTSLGVPTGWSMSYATPAEPGSLVQIRRSASSFNDAVARRRN